MLSARQLLQNFFPPVATTRKTQRGNTGSHQLRRASTPRTDLCCVDRGEGKVCSSQRRTAWQHWGPPRWNRRRRWRPRKVDTGLTSSIVQCRRRGTHRRADTRGRRVTLSRPQRAIFIKFCILALFLMRNELYFCFVKQNVLKVFFFFQIFNLKD